MRIERPVQGVRKIDENTAARMRSRYTQPMHAPPNQIAETLKKRSPLLGKIRVDEVLDYVHHERSVGIRQAFAVVQSGQDVYTVSDNGEVRDENDLLVGTMEPLF